MHPTLAELPPEILNLIVSYFNLARTLHHFSLTCKRLHEYTLENGFRVFVQSCFPSIKTPPYWRDATHALTTLEKAWDRKSIIARCLRPGKGTIHLPPGRENRRILSRRNLAQSMGFQPVIDCFEEWSSGNWRSRKEVLAWGAGPELIVRARCPAPNDRRSNTRIKGDNNGTDNEGSYPATRWLTWKESHLRDGIDDITSLNLLRPNQSPCDGAYHLVLGRASGHLEQVSLSQTGITKIPFETNDRPVRSTHISSADDPLLVACLSDGVVAVYPLPSSSCLSSSSPPTPTKPTGEMTMLEPEKVSRTWVTRFLDPTRVAIGRGPSLEPICIHEVSPYGISDALHKIRTGANSTSVYSIVPLPASGQAGESRDLILSGWYSGEVKLHDLRSPLPLVTTYCDPIDATSAIYSLCSFGHERFIAGGARHSVLKIFDLRMPGGKTYYAADLDHCSPEPALISPDACCKYHEESRYTMDYNVYMTQDSSIMSKRYSSRRESPVYSLAAASSFSPSIFAGLENNVLQLDLVSMMDKHPDLVFQPRGPWKGSRNEVIQARYNPNHDALNLVAVEHTVDRGIKAMKQAAVGERTWGVKGWDERWTRPSR